MESDMKGVLRGRVWMREIEVELWVERTRGFLLKGEDAVSRVTAWENAEVSFSIDEGA